MNLEPQTSSGSGREWRTLSRSDLEFQSYLDGSFSRTLLALPVRSLNVGSASEQVTFEIRPAGDPGAPSLFRLLWALARPSSLVFSFGPMVAIFFYAFARGLFGLPSAPHAKTIALLTVVGVFFFHMAVNLFNDYGDHMKGRDRMRPYGGSRAIQNGWVRAVTLKRAATWLIVAAAACGLPAIVLHFTPLAIFAAFALLTALEFAFQKFRLKYHGWSEILAFLLTGPCLACGFAWAVTGTVDLAEIALGCVYGSIALMYFHSANFEAIMSDGQAGLRTWATRAGFEASKSFFRLTAVLTILCSSVYVFVLENKAFVHAAFWLLPLAQLGFLFPVVRKVRMLSSPLSSGLRGLRMQAVILGWITTGAVVAGDLITFFALR